MVVRQTARFFFADEVQSAHELRRRRASRSCASASVYKVLRRDRQRLRRPEGLVIVVTKKKQQE